MGWRGMIRTIGAAIRRTNRETQRQLRAYERASLHHFRSLEQERSAYSRMADRERAANEVNLYDARIDVLLSVHKECGDQIDWRILAEADAPEEPVIVQPVRSSLNEDRARKALRDYQPAVSQKLLGMSDSIRMQLEQNIAIAKEQDARDYQAALSACRQESEDARTEWREQRLDWEATRNLARRVLAHDPTAYAEAIQRLNPFSEIEELGSKLSFSLAPYSAEIDFIVHGEDVIPAESKTLTKTGKVSSKPLSSKKRMEMYQDHICGCVIRVAREVLALLPVTTCVVTAFVQMPNPVSGLKEDQPILSLVVPRGICQKVNWDAVDPSESVKNFYHKMKFKRSVGFEVVEPIRPSR